HHLEEAPNPYNRTHTTNPQPHAEQWKAYHSAWQNYYQQYYAAYYEHQQAQKQALQGATSEKSTNESVSQSYFSGQTDLEKTTEDLSKDQALFELRQKLLGKVRTQATKIRRSRHFVPIAAALA